MQEFDPERKFVVRDSRPVRDIGSTVCSAVRPLDGKFRPDSDDFELMAYAGHPEALERIRSTLPIEVTTNRTKPSALNC